MTSPSFRPASGQNGDARIAAAKPSIDDALAAACERFRSQWQSGAGPTIEQELSNLPEDARPLMLHRLLVLEIAEARAAGHSLDLTALRRRFPQDRSIVDGAWEESWRTKPSPLTVGPGLRAVTGSNDTTSPHTDPAVTSPSDTSAVEADTITTATRYSRLRQHRKGGMSILRIAHDEDLDRETVVKSLRPEYENGEEFRRQLLAEASITGKLDHPGIVPVYGVGQKWDGTPFYTMRRIVGEDLHSHIEHHHAARRGETSASQAGTSPALDLRDLVEHLVDACNTIAYAHDAGVLHLDVKPQNIMVGRYGETFVVDWGLARPYDRSTEFRNEQTVVLRDDLRGGIDAFTRPFVSPEQYFGHPVGPAADIYSLGATLYFLVTGVPGLAGSEPDFDAILRAGKIPTARSRRPDAPKALESICQRAMAPHPAARYPTAKALAADLQAWLRDEPVMAMPERLPDRCLRTIRRHSGIVATAGASLPLIAAAIAAAVLSWSQADRYRTVARQAADAASEARVAKDEATSQRNLADARFEQAVQTFEAIVEPLATANWSNIELFGQLARHVDSFSEAFLAEARGGSSASPPPLQLARIHELRAIAASVSKNRMNLEDMQEAERSLIEALRADADDPELVRRLARNRLLQGQQFFIRERSDVSRAGTRMGTKAILEEARGGFERLKQMQGDAFGLADALLLAEVHHELGRWYLWLADNAPEEAGLTTDSSLEMSLEHFNAGLDVRDRLSRRSTKEDVVRDLARSYGFRGDLYARLGKLSQAREDYTVSEKLREKLFLAKKSNIDYRLQYCRGLANFVSLEMIAPSAPAETLATIERVDKAADMQAQLLEDYRHNTSFEREICRDLAWSLAASAELRLIHGDSEGDAPRQRDEAAKKAADAFLLLDRDTVSDDERLQSKYRYRVLEAEVTGDADRAREAREFFEKVGFEKLEPDSIWSLAVARALTGNDKGAAEAFVRLVNRGGKNRAQYEARFRRGRSLEKIADLPGVPDARERLSRSHASR